jgi:hypothetical protein
MFAGLFIETCRQKKVVAAIVSAALIFRLLKLKKQKINNKSLYEPLYLSNIFFKRI